MTTIPNVLTIAGSDSSGGAGIQADIKTFTSLGVYSTSVITNITAQNTLGISEIYELPCTLVESQLTSVFEDIKIDAVKIGMLNSKEIIATVIASLKKYHPQTIVIDPVMVSTSGRDLLDPMAIALLSEELLPLSTIITPNIPEAVKLLAFNSALTTNNCDEMANYLSDLYSTTVLLKGGHSKGETCIDTLIQRTNNSEKNAAVHFRNKKLDTTNTHGTGCTLSSAVTAFLSLGHCMKTSVRYANAYVNNAIKYADALNVGLGHGPVNHLHQFIK